MNFEIITLVILFAVKITVSFDIGSLNSIKEIIKFVAGVADSVDEEKIKAAGDLVDGIKIDGHRNYGDTVRKYFVEFPDSKVTDEDNEKLDNFIRKIDDAWTEFRSKEDGVELRESIKLLPRILNDLYTFYIGNADDTQGFLSRVTTDSKPNVCEISENNQLLLRKLHQILILSELRGFILALKASEDPQKAAARAIFHSQQFLQSSREGFRKKWNNLRSYDPPKNIRGITFSEFLGLFQGVIVNELQSDSVNGLRCYGDCDAIDYSRLVKCYDAFLPNKKITYCHTKPCNGLLTGCFNLNINIKACELNESSDRRFQWLRGMNVDTSLLRCPGKRVDLYRVAIGEYIICEVCMCVCAEQDGNSTAMRTISLIPQLADINRNMVMTGVRFAEKDRMLHLQIEQAQLGPFGEIIPGTEEWKELGDFEYDSAGEGSFRMKKGEEFAKLTEFVDFSFVALDQRTINLDELFANDGQVLIGARFIYNDVDDSFELQVKSWPIDLKAGKLVPGNPSDVEWIGWENAQRRSKNYDRPRSKLEVGETDDPLMTTESNYPVSFPNQKLLIRTTNYRDDLHQHTVPYLDLQPVTYSTVKIPLSGLEIIYKRVTGFGGFLGFRIYGFDFTNDFDCKMATSDFKKYRPNFDENLILPVSFE